MVGFKTGVALTREQMVEWLEDSFEGEGFFDFEDESEVRVRAEEVSLTIATSSPP